MDTTLELPLSDTTSDMMLNVVGITAPAVWDMPTDLRAGEIAKYCPRCYKDKRASPIPERSAFARHNKKGYQDWCKDCAALGEWRKTHSYATKLAAQAYIEKRIADREAGKTRIPPWVRKAREEMVMNTATNTPPDEQVDFGTITIGQGDGTVSFDPTLAVIEDLPDEDEVNRVNTVNEPVMAPLTNLTSFEQWASSHDAKTTLFGMDGGMSVIVRMDQNGLFHVLTSGDNPKMFGPGAAVTYVVAYRWLTLLTGMTLGQDIMGVIYR